LKAELKICHIDSSAMEPPGSVFAQLNTDPNGRVTIMLQGVLNLEGKFGSIVVSKKELGESILKGIAERLGIEGMHPQDQD
jgi:hypothetical protein